MGCFQGWREFVNDWLHSTDEKIEVLSSPLGAPMSPTPAFPDPFRPALSPPGQREETVTFRSSLGGGQMTGERD